MLSGLLLILLGFFNVCNAANPIASVRDIDGNGNTKIAVVTKNNIHHTTLDNGLGVTVIVDHSSPIVAHGVFYNVGSFDDPQNRSGMAHLLEHLMFGATTTYGNREYVRYVAEIGGQMNAFTSVDRTFYFTIMPSPQNLDQIMTFEADRMRNVIYNDTKSLESEKEVVTGELAMRDDLMTRVFNMLALELNYDFRFKRPIIGYVNDIKSITSKELEVFYDRYYAPDNAVIVVVGNVEPETVFKKAKSHFGHILNNTAKYDNSANAFVRLPRCACESKILEINAKHEKQSNVSFILSATNASMQSDNRSLVSAVAKMIGYSLGTEGRGRLHNILVEKKKLASDVTVENDGPYILISAVPAPETALDTLASEMRSILTELHTGGFTSAELKEITDFAKFNTARNRDGVMNKFMAYVETLHGGASWSTVNDAVTSGVLDKKSSAKIIKQIMFENNDLIYAKVVGGAQ